MIRLIKWRYNKIRERNNFIFCQQNKSLISKKEYESFMVRLKKVLLYSINLTMKKLQSRHAVARSWTALDR